MAIWYNHPISCHFRARKWYTCFSSNPQTNMQGLVFFFPGKEVVHLFFFDTIKLWEIPGAFLKQPGIEGLLPLLPLTQDGVHYEVVDDMIASLERAGKSHLLSLRKPIKRLERL